MCTCRASPNRHSYLKYVKMLTPSLFSLQRCFYMIGYCIVNGSFLSLWQAAYAKHLYWTCYIDVFFHDNVKKQD